MVPSVPPININKKDKTQVQIDEKETERKEPIILEKIEIKPEQNLSKSGSKKDLFESPQ